MHEILNNLKDLRNAAATQDESNSGDVLNRVLELAEIVAKLATEVARVQSSLRRIGDRQLQ